MKLFLQHENSNTVPHVLFGYIISLNVHFCYITQIPCMPIYGKWKKLMFSNINKLTTNSQPTAKWLHMEYC